MSEKNEMFELNADQLEQVIGGVNKTVNTGTNDKAAIRKGPGKGYGQITSIVNGTPVNTISDPVWDDKSGRHFIEIEFYDRNGIFRTGWIATSLIGMKR